MSYYFGIALAVLVPGAILGVAFAAAGARDRRLVHQFVRLPERRIAILGRRKAIAMEDAVSAFLDTPEGFAVADDYRIIARRELLWDTLESHMRPKILGGDVAERLAIGSYAQMMWDDRRPARGTRRRRRAEAALGLAPLTYTA